MSESAPSARKVIGKELALLLGLLLVGLVALPIAVFFVGDLVFGDYGPGGFSGFFNSLSGKIRDGDWVAWFLVLSPYFAWQTVRLTAFFWRMVGSRATEPSAASK